jgi:hypothetical protein
MEMINLPIIKTRQERDVMRLYIDKHTTFRNFL